MEAKPVICVCANRQDQSWADRLATTLRATLQGRAEVTRNLNADGEEADGFREAVSRAGAAILLTSFDLEGDQPAALERILARNDNPEDRLPVYRLAVRPGAVDRKETPLSKFPKLLEADDPLSAAPAGQSDALLGKAAANLENKVFPAHAKKQTRADLAAGASAVPRVFETDRWMPVVSEQFVGRSKELALLDGAWDAPPPVRIVGIIGCGGCGKTALLKRWLGQLKKDHDYRGAVRVLAWSFGDRRGGLPSQFFRAALQEFGVDPGGYRTEQYPARLVELLNEGKSLLILDALETVQRRLKPSFVEPPAGWPGMEREWQLMSDFLLLLQQSAESKPAAAGTSLCVLTSREPIRLLAEKKGDVYQEVLLDDLNAADATELLRRVIGSAKVDELPAEAGLAAGEHFGHPLSLHLLASELVTIAKGDVRQRDRVRYTDVDSDLGREVRATLERYDELLANSPELGVLRTLALFQGPVPRRLLDEFVRANPVPTITDSILDDDSRQRAVTQLVQGGLIRETASGSQGEQLDTYPLVRAHFAAQVRRLSEAAWRQAHEWLYRRAKRDVPRSAKTLAELQPAFRTVFHGCRAALASDPSANEVLANEVVEFYVVRIQQGSSSRIEQLADEQAFRQDIAVIGEFFERKWYKPYAVLHDRSQAFFLLTAGDRLSALDRLAEAAQAYEAAQQAYRNIEDWPKLEEAEVKYDATRSELGRRESRLQIAHAGV